MDPRFSMAALYVGDLHPEVTEPMLAERFRPAGQIHSIRLCRDRNTGSSLGYAYVNFQQRADAERALEMFHFELLMGQPMRVMWSEKDPNQRKNGIGNLFLKNLDKSIDSVALFDTFSMFGKVLSCKVVGYETGSKGYGYVQFESVDAANLAMETLHGKLLNDRKVSIEHFKVRENRKPEAAPRPPGFSNIYIKNLDEDVDEKMLKDIFSKFGTALNVRVVTDESGKSKGFGFVQYERHEDAQRALTEMNGKELNGKKLYVGRAQTKVKRQAELKHKFEQTGGTITPSPSQVPCTREECANTTTSTSVDTLHVEDTVPAVDSVPAVDTVPTEDPRPSLESVPAEDTLPLIESVPAVDTIHTEETGPSQDSAPATNRDPAVASNPVSGPDAEKISALTRGPDEVPFTSMASDVPTYPPAGTRLTIYMLESAPVDEQVQMAYDYMLPLVEKIHPSQAKKITWMLLEGENNYEIINMIADPKLLCARVEEMDALLKARDAGYKPVFYINNNNKKKKNKRKKK